MCKFPNSETETIIFEKVLLPHDEICLKITSMGFYRVIILEPKHGVDADFVSSFKIK